VIIELPMAASDYGEMVNLRSRGLRAIYPGCRPMIRINAIWLAAEPKHMRREAE